MEKRKRRRIVRRTQVSGAREVVSLQDRTGRVSIVGYALNGVVHAPQRSGVVVVMRTVCGVRIPSDRKPIPLRSVKPRCEQCWKR